MGLTSDGIGLLFTARGDTSDAKKAFKDLKDSASGDIAAVEKSGTGATSALGGGFASLVGPVSAAAAGIAAVASVGVTAAVALFAMAKSASDAGSAIKDVSDKTGLSAESLSTLKLAADQSGASLEQISTSVTKFSRLIGQAADGSETAKDSLIRLGLDPQKAINDLDGSLDKVFRSIFEAKNPIVATTLATAAFGKSGADLIPVVKQMNGDFAAFKEEATRLGVVLSEDDVNAADAFGDSLTALEAQVKGVTTQFSLGFLPAITTALQEVSGELSDNKNVWREWGEFVGGVILRLTRGVKLISALVLDVGQALSGNSQFGENLGRAVQEANESRDNEQFRKQIQDNINDPNRSEFLKQQDKDIARLGKAGRGANSIFTTDDSAAAADKSAQVQSAALEKLGGEQRKFLEQDFENSQAANLKKYLAREQTAEQFNAAFLDNERLFAEKLTQAVSADFDRQVAETTNKTAQKAIRTEQATELQKIQTEKAKRIDDANKAVIDSEAKVSDEKTKEAENRVKTTEDEVNRTLSVYAAGYALRVAQNNQAAANGLIDEKTRVAAEQKIKTEAIEDEITQNKKLLDSADLSAEKQIEIGSKIAVLNENLKTQKIEAAIAVKRAIDDETRATAEAAQILAGLVLQTKAATADLESFRQEQKRKVLENTADFSVGNARAEALRQLEEFDRQEAERQNRQRLADLEAEKNAALARIREKENEEAQKAEIERLYREKRLLSEAEFQARLAEIKAQSAPPIEQAQMDGSGGGFLGGILQGAGIGAEDLNKKLEPLKTIGNIIGGQFNAIAAAVGSAVQAFVLYGNAGTSVRKVTAQILASIAQQSAVQAVYELAQGFAKLALAFFGVPNAGPSATAHFTAAATYGLVAGVSAIAGRAVAGDSFKQQSSGAFGASGNGQNGGNNGTNGTGQTGSRSFTGGAFSSSGDKVTTFENGINSPQIVRHEIDLTDSSGKRSKFIVNTIETSANSNGTIRNLIRDVVNDL